MPVFGKLAAEGARRVGQMSPNKQRAAALAAVLAIAGADGALNALEGSPTVTTEAGEASVTRVFSMPPKECHGGYDVEVNGAKAKINKAIPILPDNWASIEFNGKVTAEVCNSSDPNKSAYTVVIMDKGDDRHVTATLAPDAFTTTIYQTNPTDAGAYKYDNSIVGAAVENFSNFAKSIPVGVEMTGADAVQNTLRGLALEQAFADASGACGATAWEPLRPIYEEQLVSQVVDNNNLYADQAHQITADDVTVNTPEPSQIQFETQYSDDLEKIEKDFNDDGLTLTAASVSMANCTLNTNMQVQGSR